MKEVTVSHTIKIVNNCLYGFLDKIIVPASILYQIRSSNSSWHPMEQLAAFRKLGIR